MSVIGDLPLTRFDPETLTVTHTVDSPRPGWLFYGLAYRAADDTFYLAGENRIRRLSGLDSAKPGTVLGECVPEIPWISGLALNERTNVLWGVKNDVTGEAIYAFDPDTCALLGSVPDPDPDVLSGAGLEIDADGHLWTVGQAYRAPYAASVYHVDGSLPAYSDVPWLTVTAPTGTIPPGGRADLPVTVDATGLAPGVHTATLFLLGNGAKTPVAPVTVTVTVS